MKDLKQFMKEKNILNIRVDVNSLTKEQIATYNTYNQIVLYLTATTYYTDNFIQSFDMLAPIIIPEKWRKNKIDRKIVDISLKIKDFISDGSGFLKSTGLIVNLLQYVIKIIEKIESAFGKYHIISQYLQLYKAFAKIITKNLAILLYNAGGSKDFSEANQFVEKHIMKYFKLTNEPEALLNTFIKLTAIISSLSKTTSEGGWESLKEEVFKHGGTIDGEKPTE